MWEGLPTVALCAEASGRGPAVQGSGAHAGQEDLASRGDLKIYETCPRQYQSSARTHFTPSRSAATSSAGRCTRLSRDPPNRPGRQARYTDQPRIRDLFDRTLRFLVASDVRPIGAEAVRLLDSEVLNYFRQNHEEMRRVIGRKLTCRWRRTVTSSPAKWTCCSAATANWNSLTSRPQRAQKNSPELIAAYELTALHLRPYS